MCFTINPMNDLEFFSTLFSFKTIGQFSLIFVSQHYTQNDDRVILGFPKTITTYWERNQVN